MRECFPKARAAGLSRGWVVLEGEEERKQVGAGTTGLQAQVGRHVASRDTRRGGDREEPREAVGRGHIPTPNPGSVPESNTKPL